MPIKPGAGRPTAGSIKKPNAPKGMTSSPLSGVKNKSLPSKPNKSGSKGKGKGSGGGGGIEATAKRLTNGVIRDEVRDLKSQRKELTRSAAHANSAVRTQYQHGVGDIEHVAGTTGGFINAQNAQGQAGFDAAKIEQSAMAAALQNQLGNVYAAGEGSATDELARLGITGPTTGADPGGFLGQLASDKSNAMAVGAQTSMNSQSNLGLAQANAGAVGNLLASMNQGSAMSAIGQNLNARNAGFADNREALDTGLATVRDAIADAKGTRKDTFFQLLTQLKQSGWGKMGSGARPAPAKNPAKPPVKAEDKKKSEPKKGK